MTRLDRTLRLGMLWAVAAVSGCSGGGSPGSDAFLSDSPVLDARPGGDEWSSGGGASGEPLTVDRGGMARDGSDVERETFAARRGSVLFVASAVRGPQAIDLREPAAPRRLAATWPAGSIAALDVLDDTLVAVEGVDPRSPSARVRVEAWDVSAFHGGAGDPTEFPAPAMQEIPGVFAGLLHLGPNVVLATFEGLPGSAEAPTTALRSVRRTGAGAIALGEPRRVPHFFDASTWVAPRLLPSDTTLWVASPELAETWQTRFLALDGRSAGLDPRSDVAAFVVPGVVDGPASVEFGPDVIDCLTVAKPGYASEGPVVFHRVRPGIGGAGGAEEPPPATIETEFEWPKTAGIGLRRPILLTPGRAFVLFTEAETWERMATLGVLDTSDPAAPQVGARLDVAWPFLATAAGNRWYGVSLNSEAGVATVTAVDSTDAAALRLAGGAPRDLGPPVEGGMGVFVEHVGAVPWASLVTQPCACGVPETSVLPLTDAFFESGGVDAGSATVALPGGPPRFVEWGEGLVVAVGRSIRALGAPGALALPLAVPVGSAVLEGDDVVRSRPGVGGAALERVPLASLLDGSEVEPEGGLASPPRAAVCDPPCNPAQILLPPFVAPDATTPLGVSAHGWVDTTAQTGNESTCEAFERYAPGAAGRDAPVSEGCVAWEALGLVTNGTAPTPTSVGYAYPRARLSGRGADAVYARQVAVVDLRGPTPQVEAWPIPGDELGPIFASGDQVVTSHALPEGDRVRFFLDRIDYTNPDAPVAASPISVPGRVFAYDHAAQRLLAAEYVRVGGALPDDEVRLDTRFHAVRLNGERAESLATATIEGLAVRQAQVDGRRALSVRYALTTPDDFSDETLVVVTGWHEGETLTVREHTLPEAFGPLYEWQLIGDHAVLRGSTGLVLADLRGGSMVYREVPTAGEPPRTLTGDARALLLPFGQDGLRVVPFDPP